MEDFDLLYLLKTPFYLGNPTKAMNEATELEIDESDTKNDELKSFFMIRILAELGDMPRLKALMTKMYEKHDEMVQLAGCLIQYFVSGNVAFDVEGEIQKALKAPNSYPISHMTVLVYITYLTKDYDNLFHLTNRTKNLEFLSVKFLGYLQIYRYDLAKETLNQMQSLDDDNCLSGICEAILGFVAKDEIDKSREKIVELGEKNEYTIKIYTLLGLTMMRENKFENALKVFDKALEALNILGDHTQYQKYVVKGNEDLAAFWVNYIKWNSILYNTENENKEKLEKVLKIVSPNHPYWEEQEAAFKMFDEAI